MTITINGSGTITGLSVGGLPDGIVDTDMLATGAVTAVKRGAGSILQFKREYETDHRILVLILMLIFSQYQLHPLMQQHKY